MKLKILVFFKIQCGMTNSIQLIKYARGSFELSKFWLRGIC